MLHLPKTFIASIIFLSTILNFKQALSEPIAMTPSLIKNITIYADDGKACVVYKDGHYSMGKDAQDPEYEFGEIEKIAIGDLNNDNIPDAAFAAWSSNGTSKYYFLYVATGNTGKISLYDTYQLGINLDITSLKINNNKICIKIKGGGYIEDYLKNPCPFTIKGNKLILQDGAQKATENQKATQQLPPAEDGPGQQIIGTWRGVFHAKNSNGKPYTVGCEYVITKDKSNPDNYYFKQIDTLTFLDSTDTFSCSSKNSYSNSYEGQIVVNHENLKFIQKVVANPRCGSLGTDYFRIAGDHLEVVNFNDGKVMTGVLIKQE